MIHLGDITKINGGAIPPVDVIIGGSPCQDLSIAGKRSGLQGERSGLFMEQIRIIKEMRNTYGTDYPRFMVWENVPGAFSSNNGEDFRAVLEETVRIIQPDAVIPRPEKWRTSGYILGDGWSIAWRILDAQFWGVPQRRRRISLIADFGGNAAPEILFVRKGLSGDPPPGGTQRKKAAADVERGIREVIGVDAYNHTTTGEIAVTVTAASGSSPTHSGPMVLDRPIVYGLCSDASNSMKSNNPHSGIYEAKTTRTLDLNGGNPSCNQGGMMVLQPERTYQEKTGPLMANSHPGNYTGQDAYSDMLVTAYPDPANTLLVKANMSFRGDQDTLIAAVDCRNGVENPDVNGTLQAKSSGGTSYNLQNTIRVNQLVRRLTPLECERLQGYPDGWTNIGEWTDSKGKKRQTTDGARYKALGNSIALPPWKWILKRICSLYERDSTMGSLFDGIGGFPLIWEQLNGKESCLWASEIEEFCIAITEKRFGS